jgi:hypothetical protein
MQVLRKVRVRERSKQGGTAGLQSVLDSHVEDGFFIAQQDRREEQSEQSD